MRFSARAGQHEVLMDYPLQAGEDCAGLRPLEVLLSSLAGCAGSTIALLLRKMEQPFQGLRVNVKGVRQDEHPTVITAIDMEFVVTGEGLDSAAVGRAAAMAEEKLCPVWAMLKSGPAISSSVRIEAVPA
jgi:putative redox protein